MTERNEGILNIPVPRTEEGELSQISMLALAHIGDGVYELLTRAYLVAHGHTAVMKLHRDSVKRVCAPAQAAAAGRLLPHLTEQERDVYRRGRNAKVNSVPKRAELAQYHAATGLEALFGWLYLKGMDDRINELFSIVTEEQ